MKQDYRSSDFKKLLDSLQQQSWQLELLISGFSIFGLFQAIPPLRVAMSRAFFHENDLRILLINAIIGACYILLFNLLLHVLLRGLWIGALGLRYVSGDIDFDYFKYSDKFKNYLKDKIISFDRYIARLEDYCSLIFAISFLLIFFWIAFGIWSSIFVLISNHIINNETLPEWFSKIIGRTLLVSLLASGLIIFIDLISQGIFKRNKWVAKFYFPIYWFFSFLTLSFLYRPIVYNFLDNKFGKKVFFWLIPIYITILIVSGLERRTSNFLLSDLDSSNHYMNKENYWDEMIEDYDFPGGAVIPSKIINHNYLEVFIPHSESLENQIYAYKPSIQPKKDKRGIVNTKIKINIGDSDNDSIKNHRMITKFLTEFNKMHYFKIDSITTDSEFISTTDKKGNLGFETFINIKDLAEGKHLLSVIGKRKKEDSAYNETLATIPFWYYKS